MIGLKEEEEKEIREEKLRKQTEEGGKVMNEEMNYKGEESE